MKIAAAGVPGRLIAVMAVSALLACAGPPDTIAAGDIGRFWVEFRPELPGEYHATIILEGLEETMELVGSAREPTMAYWVSLDSLSFGDVILERQVEHWVAVWNSGDLNFDLDIGLLDPNTDFWIEHANSDA